MASQLAMRAPRPPVLASAPEQSLALAPALSAAAEWWLLLPLCSGQRVLILGHAIQTAAALSERNVAPIVILPADDAADAPRRDAALIETDRLNAPQQALPLAASSVDHVLIPELAPARAAWMLAEAARVLRPGGWLLVSARHARGLRRPRAWLARLGRNGGGRMGLSLGKVLRALGEAGMKTSMRYGVHDDRGRLPYLVPLDYQNALRYYFQQVFVPRSRLESALQRSARLLAALELQSSLFPRVVVVAHRLGAQEAG